MYTASTAFLEALTEAGVSYLFVNFGSDHTSIIESLAEARASGRKIPTVVTCPNEMVALSAAQGFAQASGRAQAVIVHVDCGTQALAGALHNVARARVPVFIFAGASPFTQEGELRGSRNEFIQWLQDAYDQRGIVRSFVKYENEFRTGRNVKQLVHRAMQFARSDPQGPVYLIGGREVMEEETSPVKVDAADWQTIEPTALPPQGVEAIVEDLRTAKRPLVVTSYLGRNPKAVGELVRLCDRLAIAVHQSAPNRMNFPADHPMHQGFQHNEPRQSEVLAQADLVLVLDSDVPWIPVHNKPGKDARIYHIDVDPIKDRMPLWYISARQVFRADSALALSQINARLDGLKLDADAIERRRAHYRGLNATRNEALRQRERPDADVITPEFLTACIRQNIGNDALVLNEGVTNYTTIHEHMRMTRPGSVFASGGSSLGWNGGAAIGAKLAEPDRLVVSLTGDGSYMFSVPSTVHWMARKYATPFLTIIYNNRGWRAPKLSALAVHPDGYMSRANNVDVSFDPPPDYSAIAAAAGGAHGQIVKHANDLEPAVKRAIDIVRNERRCAVLDVWLPRL